MEENRVNNEEQNLTAEPVEDLGSWTLCEKDIPCSQCEETETCEKYQQRQTEQTASKKKTWILGVAVAAVVAVVAILGIFTAKYIKSAKAANGQLTIGQYVSDLFSGDSDNTAHTNEQGYTSYYVTGEQLTAKVQKKVVAQCGEDKLTNKELPLYYWQEYSYFMNELQSMYGQYASMFVNASTPFDQQIYSQNEAGEVTTFQQYFLESALSNFGMVSAISQDAEAHGFVLSAEEESYLSALPDTIAQQAAAYGFADADEFLQASYGPSVDMDTYMAYVRDNLTASTYLNLQVENLEFTDADVEAYYDENEALFLQNGIQKLDKPMVHVRHILIMPAQDETGASTDADWAAAKEAIQAVYDQWLAGDMTEESFAALASEHSVDGSATNGGLIQNVYPGQMVENFHNWCFADGRQVGDHGVVETEFGYHIIYLSGVTEQIYWRTVAENQYLNFRSTELTTQICEAMPAETFVQRAALIDIMAAQNATVSE